MVNEIFPLPGTPSDSATSSQDECEAPAKCTPGLPVLSADDVILEVVLKIHILRICKYTFHEI